MKRLYTLSVFLFAALLSFAQTDVTFSVDMSNETVSANGVHVAGDFQGWDPGATELTDPDGDGIYTVTVPVSVAQITFKFVNDNDWGADEFTGMTPPTGGTDCVVQDGDGNFNRQEDIPTGETEYALPTYIFNSCETVLNTEDPFFMSLDLKATPNPFYGNTLLSFNNPNAQSFQVQITDLSGRLVRTYQNVNGTNLLITDLIHPGMYFATLINEVGAGATYKLVVQ